MIYIHYIGGYVFLHEFLDKRRVYKSKRVHFLTSHYKLENSPPRSPDFIPSAIASYA